MTHRMVKFYEILLVKKGCEKKVRELPWKTYERPKLRMGEDNDEQIGADHFMLLHEKQRSFQKLCL